MRLFRTPLVVCGLLIVGNCYGALGKKASPHLSHCLSESFDQEQCLNEVSQVERAYPNYSAPKELIVVLASAYHNLAYVGPPGPAKDLWVHKAVELYNSISSSADTADRFFLASTVAPTLEAREESLRKALALSSSHSAARRDLIRMLLDRGDVRGALTEWNILSKSPRPVRGDVDPMDGIRLANLAAAGGDLVTAKEVILNVMRTTTDLDSVARCQLFKAADLLRLQLDEATLTTVKDITQVCENVKHRNNAVTALMLGDKAQAENELAAQIRDNPKYTEAYLLLEELQRSTGRWDKALKTIQDLWRADVGTTEKCAAMSRIPLQAYGTRGTELTEEVRRACQMKKQ